jgi:hypothetical protein
MITTCRKKENNLFNPPAYKNFFLLNKIGILTNGRADNQLYLVPYRYLKVSTNEKRGGLKLVAFDRPPFKLLSRKFSKESVQAPSCERHKTTQRTPVSIICKQLLIPNNAIVSGCDTLFTSYT